MKKVLIFGIFIFNISVFSQVGVSTTTPQKALHISGTTSSTTITGTSVNIVRPTIRVDGLNNTNQSTTDKLRPVSVSDKGDLVLSNALVKPLVIIDPINTSNTEKDYILPAVTINQTSGSTTTNAVIRSFNFTLTSPSLVKFSTVTSFQFLRASDGGVVTDGSNRAWGTRFRFSAAPAGISTAANAYFGESIRAYNNAVNTTDATGTFYTASDDTLSLPAGTYTLDVNLFAATNATQTPLRIICGSGTDTISIVAFPVQ
ncbi:hypothetical protein N6B72_06040 [Chryseobacterium soli]|uniref:hypothetical protein n=1 Tax=Chryseobacterium soli TaxID=445961 RepID=UPI002952BCCD|nr:hypothetical protein [Chryseobacterium soli]MDV7696477.1 hypothetical protein [Chryseobacterium soli]